MKILNDQGFVEQDDGTSGFGLIKGADGHSSWSLLPLRLTASGHQFVEALSNREVWSTIKKSFKDTSITTLRDVSIKLLEEYAQKKINTILDFDSETLRRKRWPPSFSPPSQKRPAELCVGGITSRWRWGASP
jgi:hypothetical protein